MATQYVYGTDTGRNGNQPGRYITDWMGRCDTLAQAVIESAAINPSWGPYIYEVDMEPVPKITRNFGIRAGSITTGYRVVGGPYLNYEHPAWPGRERPA